MKRALAMALGAMMVAGSAAPAAASSAIDFSGYYRVYYGMDSNLGHQNGDAAFTDDYFGHRLNLDVTFTPTDEIAVYWRLRGPHFQRWGAAGNSANLVTRHIYGEIKQDWGTVLVGRLHEDLDYWGLAHLGHSAYFTFYSSATPFDDAAPRDAIRYTNRWDNGFQLMAQYTKMSAQDWTGGVVPSSSYAHSTGGGTTSFDVWDADRDWDRIEAEGAYFWDGGGASMAVRYDRDARGTNTADLAAAIAEYGLGVGDPQWSGAATATAWYLNPAITHSFGDFTLSFEGKAGWGKQERTSVIIDPMTYDDFALWQGGLSRDLSGYGLYLDADYNYGPGNVTLASWWVSGTELDDRIGDLHPQDSKSLVNMGDNFYPLAVAYGYTAGIRGRAGAAQASGNSNAVALANNGYVNYINAGYGSTAGGATGKAFLAGSDTASEIGNAAFGVNLGGGAAGDGLATNMADFYGDYTRKTSLNQNTMANHWGIMLAGNHAFTDDISMHYGIGYLALNESNYRVANRIALDGQGATVAYTTQYENQSKDLGVELDLGFSFQLLDNLKLTTTAGYMFTGDAYKELKGYTYTQTRAASGAGNGDAAGIMNAVWEDGKDAYTVQSTLQFNF